MWYSHVGVHRLHVVPCVSSRVCVRWTYMSVFLWLSHRLRLWFLVVWCAAWMDISMCVYWLLCVYSVTDWILCVWYFCLCLDSHSIINMGGGGTQCFSLGTTPRRCVNQSGQLDDELHKEATWRNEDEAGKMWRHLPNYEKERQNLICKA